jgi:hypothetical protein
VDEGPHAVEVDVRVAAFGHAPQRGEHRLERVRDFFQPASQAARIARARRFECGQGGAQCLRGQRLDLDVDQDEPVFVLASQEIL